MKFKPYQVGDNDIVLAENEQQAREIFVDEWSGDIEMDEFEVEDLSSRLDMQFHCEDGKPSCTLGDYIKDLKEPQYIVGWE
jgi:hypothetical protein